MEAQIHTGRTHQIRVHFQFLGHPLVGDDTYGAKQNSRLTELTGYAAPRVMLHARELSFIHPRTEKPMSFEAPLPEDFRQASEVVACVNAELNPKVATHLVLQFLYDRDADHSFAQIAGAGFPRQDTRRQNQSHRGFAPGGGNYVRNDPAARNAMVEHIRARAGTWDGDISGEELLRRTRP